MIRPIATRVRRTLGIAVSILLILIGFMFEFIIELPLWCVVRRR